MNLIDIALLAALLLLPAFVIWYYYKNSNKNFFVYHKEPVQFKNRDYDYFKVNLRNNVLNYVSEQEYADNYLNNPITQAQYHAWLNDGWKN